jgi:hypothetical protein
LVNFTPCNLWEQNWFWSWVKPDKSFPNVISSQRLATITSYSDEIKECGPKEHEVEEVWEWNWHQHYKYTNIQKCCYHANMHYLIIHKMICGHVRFNLLHFLKNSIIDVQIIPCLSYETGMWLPTASICYYALFQCNIALIMWKDDRTTKPSNKFQTFVLNMFINP